MRRITRSSSRKGQSSSSQVESQPTDIFNAEVGGPSVERAQIVRVGRKSSTKVDEGSDKEFKVTNEGEDVEILESIPAKRANISSLPSSPRKLKRTLSSISPSSPNDDHDQSQDLSLRPSDSISRIPPIPSSPPHLLELVHDIPRKDMTLIDSSFFPQPSASTLIRPDLSDNKESTTRSNRPLTPSELEEMEGSKPTLDNVDNERLVSSKRFVKWRLKRKPKDSTINKPVIGYGNVKRNFRKGAVEKPWTSYEETLHGLTSGTTNDLEEDKSTDDPFGILKSVRVFRAKHESEMKDSRVSSVLREEERGKGNDEVTNVHEETLNQQVEEAGIIGSESQKDIEFQDSSPLSEPSPLPSPSQQSPKLSKSKIKTRKPSNISLPNLTMEGRSTRRHLMKDLKGTEKALMTDQLLQALPRARPRSKRAIPKNNIDRGRDLGDVVQDEDCDMENQETIVLSSGKNKRPQLSHDRVRVGVGVRVRGRGRGKIKSKSDRKEIISVQEDEEEKGEVEDSEFGFKVGCKKQDEEVEKRRENMKQVEEWNLEEELVI